MRIGDLLRVCLVFCVFAGLVGVPATLVCLRKPEVTDEGDSTPTSQSARRAESTREQVARLRDSAVKHAEAEERDAAVADSSKDGPWSQWDENGGLKGSGEYRHGLRQGKWIRWFNAGECKIISSAMYKGFEAPFVAEATFVDGKLHGVWTICDRQGRVASEWEFEHGEFNGKSVWFFASGHKQREVEYQQGQIEGELLEWAMEADPATKNQKGARKDVHTLVTKALYQNGRRQSAVVETYSPGVKKAEGTYLYAKEVTKTSHDFWNGEIYQVTLGKEGANQRHGHWIWWYKDGGKQMEGDYDRDQPVGLHVWWHPNGQKMTAGEYEGGLETGRWVWWHVNGQKMTEGNFQDGKQIGKWVRWSAQGKVEESRDFDKVQ